MDARLQVKSSSAMNPIRVTPICGTPVHVTLMCVALLHAGLPGRQRGQRLQRRGAQHDPAPPRRQHPATLRLRPKRWPICPARLSRGRRRGRRQRWREQGRADRGRRGRGGRRRAAAGCRAVCVEVVPSEGGAGAR